MKIIEATDYKHMSELACRVLVTCLKSKPNALFCVATGSSPIETYRLFVQEVKSQNINTDQMRIIKLDEWCGLAKDNPATCEYYIRQHILTPLGIPNEHYISFNPMEANSRYECERITGLLEENNGIDCCILGVGKNGHLGLNEPRAELNPFIHKADLDAKTKMHTMLDSANQSVSHGYTLGLKAILDSNEVLLLVTGDGKLQAYQNLQKKTINSMKPANYLWLHNKALCIIDQSSL